ncbi:MAG: PepSY domain-containing protein [Methyloceanibacter sp.]|uniref:PepSY domain-containing protein n=1 Tax=Methyloceanibacter sp. TaxID=1965321 RepID=UPI003D6CE85C
MRLMPVLLALVLGAGLTAPPALAAYVDIETVRAIAFDHGIVRLKEIELDDGVWEVEGKDARGQEIEMEVDARSGRIIKMKRD